MEGNYGIVMANMWLYWMHYHPQRHIQNHHRSASLDQGRISEQRDQFDSFSGITPNRYISKAHKDQFEEFTGLLDVTQISKSC